LGWLTTCWGAPVVVVVVDGATGEGATEVLVVVCALAVVEVVDATGAVVVGGLAMVVVVTGFGASVDVVVAAPAAAASAPVTPSRGAHTMTAAPARTTRFEFMNLSAIGTSLRPRSRRVADCTYRTVRNRARRELIQALQDDSKTQQRQPEICPSPN